MTVHYGLIVILVILLSVCPMLFVALAVATVIRPIIKALVLETLKSDFYQFVWYGIAKLLPTATLSAGETYKEVCLNYSLFILELF